MSDHNLNPHAEARVAMALWSDRYSKQTLGCMDFYDGLTADQKSTCAQIVDGIIYADRADGRTPAPSPISMGGLRADNARLREALAPFAAEAETWPAGQAPDDYRVKIMLSTKTLPSRFTAGDLRRAFAVFNAPPPAERGAGWQEIGNAPLNETVAVYWPIVELDEDGDVTDKIVGGEVFVSENQGGYWIEPEAMNAIGEHMGDHETYANHPSHWMPKPSAPEGSVDG